MYNDRCVICQGDCNPYEDNPELATATLLHLPNVHHLGNRRRSTVIIVCNSCLQKLGDAFERKFDLIYDRSNMNCTCLSLLDDPKVAATNGNKLEQYLGMAKFLVSRNGAFTPLDYTDFRHAIQWQLTSDWSSRMVTDFVSEMQYYWNSIDFYDLTARLWSLFDFHPRRQTRVIVKHRFSNNGWPAWEHVKTERHLRDEFAVLISTEPESKVFSSYYLSAHRWNEYPDVVEDFDIDTDNVIKFLRELTPREITSDYGSHYIGTILYRATGQIAYDGNIGMRKIRSGGSFRYEG